jgi:hypothetical protein
MAGGHPAFATSIGCAFFLARLPGGALVTQASYVNVRYGLAKALFKKPGKPLSRPSARFIPPNNPPGWCFTTGAGAEVAGVPISLTARFLCLADLDSGSTLAACQRRGSGLWRQARQSMASERRCRAEAERRDYRFGSTPRPWSRRSRANCRAALRAPQAKRALIGSPARRPRCVGHQGQPQHLVTGKNGDRDNGAPGDRYKEWSRDHKAPAYQAGD